MASLAHQLARETRSLHAPRAQSGEGESLAGICERIGAEPFAPDDVTVGTEDELQSAVIGDAWHVDLPLTIRDSAYYQNTRRRAMAGAASSKTITGLDHYLEANEGGVWEHSWVRVARRRLHPYARRLLDTDLLRDRTQPERGSRTDTSRFLVASGGETLLRIPVSAMLRLSLAQAIGRRKALPALLRREAESLLSHFSNDNTSPETASCWVAPLRTASLGVGRGTVRETALRFLLTQVLAEFANEEFGLRETGQDAQVYFSPHPPMRLSQLNDCVSDAFYRELFMNPCLAGWSDGQAKHEYMGLCHQVLSRSQMNAVAKLREAGIIVNDLVLLPTLSSVSLANNGTHISLGSRALTARLGAGSADFGAAEEKRLGDFVTKIVEHFLPLFVGLYSAAPMRMDFVDFHPERALGFLPHQLDYTHLRQLWQGWKEKARLGFLGRVLTPFGPRLFDRFVGGAFGLEGDLMADCRLLDYPVALLSTDRSPSLDGTLGNTDRLKADLASLGVFDEHMPVYLPYRLRSAARMGFSGFEGRFHSLFAGFGRDLGPAVALQSLVTALAFRYAASGDFSHPDVPDTPAVESERRFALFGAAIGLPAFYVHHRTTNRFMRRILDATEGVRRSVRHASYLKVPLAGYRRALLKVLAEDAAPLVEAHGAHALLDDAKARLDDPAENACGARLVRDILAEAGARSPWRLSHREFGAAAEYHYRTTLRERHVREAFLELTASLAETAALASRESRDDGDAAPLRVAAREVLGERSGGVDQAELSSLHAQLRSARARQKELLRLVDLLLLAIAGERVRATDA
jgi:hypothetical protein